MFAAQAAGSSNVMYKNVQVFPPGATAQSVRRGGCTEGISKGLAPFYVAAATGHAGTGDQSSPSSLFAYVEDSPAMLVPWARVVGGWLPLPYGHTGAGATPASLAPLINMGVPEDTLEDVADKVFHLKFGLCSPEMLRSGALRPFVRVMLAQLVMYAPAMLAAGECSLATKSLLTVMVDLKIARSDTVSAMLASWSAAITGQFSSDNLALAGGSEDDKASLEAVARAMKAQKDAFDEQNRVLRRAIKELRDEFTMCTDMLERQGRAADARSPAGRPARRAAGSPGASGSLAADVSAYDAEASTGAASCAAVVSDGAAVAAGDTSHGDAASEREPNALDALRYRPGASPYEFTTLSGLAIASFVPPWLKNKMRLSPADMPRGQTAMKCIKMVTESSDINLMTDITTDESFVAALASRAHWRLLWRFRSAYVEAFGDCTIP
jgi:hypothetical protein